MILQIMIKSNYFRNGLRVLAILFLLMSILSDISAFSSDTIDPSASGYKGRKGTTLYVSKSGNNTDGSSWEQAYQSIQTALSAIPDDKGGHMIIIRPEEPSIFRRCYFLGLDWVGDTGAVLVGGWEETMPSFPHLILEDCTLVHPDNALAMSYASNCVRVQVIGCRFIVLNFTQSEMGGKSTGIICTQGHRQVGKLHVDLEDSILAGFSIFTNGEDGKAVTYTIKGKVQAYVQFKQTVPEGFERVNLWPVQLFDKMAIPMPETKKF